MPKVQYDTALRYLDKAAILQPGDARIAYQQGRINDVLYNFRFLSEYSQAAIEAYQRAINLNPLNGFHYDGLGWAYLHSSDYGQALMNFQEALKRDPNRGDYLYAIGRAYERLEQFDEAIAFYERALAIRPRHPHREARRALERLLKP